MVRVIGAAVMEQHHYNTFFFTIASLQFIFKSGIINIDLKLLEASWHTKG